MSMQQAVQSVRKSVQTLLSHCGPVVATVFPEPFQYQFPRPTLAHVGPMACDTMGNILTASGNKLLWVQTLRVPARSVEKCIVKECNVMVFFKGGMYTPPGKKKQSYQACLLLVANNGAMQFVVNPAGKPVVHNLLR
jgi:hypothetical protein